LSAIDIITIDYAITADYAAIFMIAIADAYAAFHCHYAIDIDRLLIIFLRLRHY
jgi:hypothetical protein